MLPECWKRSTVGEGCLIKNYLRLPLSSEQRALMQGEYPYYGPTGVLGYLDHYRIDEEIALIGEDGDHFLKHRDREMTLFIEGKSSVNNHAHVVGNSESCLAKWFYYWFMHRDITPMLSRQGVGRYKLTKAGLEKLEIWLPPVREQRKIARALATWDIAISMTKKLLVNSRKQKQALMHQVLSGFRRLSQFNGNISRATTPHGSIPADWSYPRIEAMAQEISVKHSSGADYPVLSCTKHDGLVDSLQYFKKRVFSEDLSTYKVVPRGSFVYATNHIEEGSIGYQDLYDFGLVSPMYTVFKTNGEVDDSYLYRLLKTEHYRQVFAAATNASVDRRGSLRWKEFKKLHIPLPSLEEQRAIAELLDLADREIELFEGQLKSLRTEKTALMQQLLTGKRRVKLDEPAEEASAA